MSESSLPQIIPIPNKQIKDIVGQRFGRLVALGYVGNIPCGKKSVPFAAWLCLCDCGNTKVILGSNLRLGYTQSCGCLRNDRTSEALTTHGMVGTPEYRSWSHMLERCQNSSCASYPDYGERGIRVCVRWQGFENFLSDIGKKPGLQYSIDRIDVDGNYSCGHCPECIRNGWAANCRWATPVEQQNNKRNSRVVEFDGESMTMAQWSRRLGFGAHVIHNRLKAGWSVAQALTTPVDDLLKKEIEFQGESMSITAWSRRIGISTNALRKRIYKNNWPIDVALTTPVAKQYQRSKK